MKTYSSKSNARRAALAYVQGTEQTFEVVEVEGGFAFRLDALPEIENGAELLAAVVLGQGEARITDTFAEDDEPEAVATIRAKGAVAQVHAICDSHPELRRSDVVALCVDRGININTAKTQYQRWFASRKAPTS